MNRHALPKRSSASTKHQEARISTYSYKINNSLTIGAVNSINPGQLTLWAIPYRRVSYSDRNRKRSKLRIRTSRTQMVKRQLSALAVWFFTCAKIANNRMETCWSTLKTWGAAATSKSSTFLRPSLQRRETTWT